MDPRLVANLTETTQVDGVYIFEIDPPGFIRGVGSGIVGMAGDFERGPVNEVVEIGSTAEFTRIFGGFGEAPAGEESTWRGYSGFRALANKVWPAGLRVVRCSATGMASAGVEIPVATHEEEDEEVTLQGRTLTVTAKTPGRHGNGISVRIDAASDASLDAGFKLTIISGSDAESIDNLSASMTVGELAAATTGLALVSLALANDDDAEVDEWPESYTLAGGSDGTAALLSWTNALDKVLARRDVNVIFYAEPNDSPVTFTALNAHLMAKVAPGSGGQPFVLAVLAGSKNDDIGDAVTEAALVRSDRVVYAWPWRKQRFAAASPVHVNGELTVPSNDVIASALVSLDPVLDPACYQGARFISAATSGLEFDNLTRDTYVTANQQGVCALEFDPDIGHRIVSGITTSLKSGRTQIHVRRVADYLIRSVARELKFYQNQPITRQWKRDVDSAIRAFLKTEKDAVPIPRIVDFTVDTETVNSAATEAQGIYKIKMSVQVTPSARALVLLAEIGTTVNIDLVEAA